MFILDSRQKQKIYYIIFLKILVLNYVMEDILYHLLKKNGIVQFVLFFHVFLYHMSQFLYVQGMSFKIKKDILFQILLCLSMLMTSQSTETDIFCLKSIKNSLEDPNNYLTSSWNFNNKTEGFICRFNGVECWHPDEI